MPLATYKRQTDRIATLGHNTEAEDAARAYQMTRPHDSDELRVSDLEYSQETIGRLGYLCTSKSDSPAGRILNGYDDLAALHSGAPEEFDRLVSAEQALSLLRAAAVMPRLHPAETKITIS
jgi:hypothetical protein